MVTATKNVLASINARRPDFEAYIDIPKAVCRCGDSNSAHPAHSQRRREENSAGAPDAAGKGLKALIPFTCLTKALPSTGFPVAVSLPALTPAIRMHYGPDSYYGHEVSVLEVDGQFDRLEEMIYIESHLSNTSTKYYGEMTELLLKHREYPGSSNGSGLFQVLVGLKMRATYERLTATNLSVATHA